MTGEPGAEDPVLLGHESVDLGLAIADHLQGDRLDAPRREAALDLVPEQRRQLETHQPVEHAPRLLGVDQVLVGVTSTATPFTSVIGKFHSGLR